MSKRAMPMPQVFMENVVLRDDETSEMIHDEVVEVIELRGEIHTPSPVREGIADVLSFRGFVRAIRLLGRSDDKSGLDAALERALVKTINLNGAIARVIEDGRR